MTFSITLRVGIFVLIASLLGACGGGSSSETNRANAGPSADTSLHTEPSALSSPSTTRDWLTKQALLSDTYPHASPIHNGYFMPVGDVGPALHDFAGSIRLQSRRLIGNFDEFYIRGDESFKNFPQVDLSFISHNGYLIPLNRQRQVSLTDNSFWGIILDPGRVWSEATDDGWSRASFPFTFISARRNQGHNGVATFLFNDSEISNLRLQITQETALWFRQDIYAQLIARYSPETYANQHVFIDAFEQELGDSVEIKPWSALDAIGSNTERRQFNSDLADSLINQAALIKDGDVYLQGCFTRYGAYPYCRWMRNGAYSVTKSIGAALTLFRLAQRYGDHVFDLLISDYVEVTANHAGWNTVTFGDALNMATGIGDNGAIIGSGDIFADENQSKMESWIARDSEQGKLDISFSYGDYPWGPGEVFRYNSVMYFVLAAALDNYYKSVAGDDADVWQMVVEEVFHPIGIQHVPMLRTIESDGSLGIVEMFHGLYPNVDDMAKLATLLHQEGVHNGEPLLHRDSVREALFRTSEQGLRSWWEDNQFGQSRYLHGFWTSPFGDLTNCALQVPYMSGYGGNVFAVMDNGLAIFRFTDAERYSPADMIRIANNERGLCAAE